MLEEYVVSNASLMFAMLHQFLWLCFPWSGVIPLDILLWMFDSLVFPFGLDLVTTMSLHLP